MQLLAVESPMGAQALPIQLLNVIPSIGYRQSLVHRNSIHAIGYLLTGVKVALFRVPVERLLRL